MTMAIPGIKINAMKIIKTAVVAVFFLLAGCKNENNAVPLDEADTISTRDEPIARQSENTYRPKLPTTIAYVDTHRIRVEIADDNAERSQGLMYRDFLPDSAGMLFIFEDEGQHPFWMKNTFIPLSIAFIDADSIITDIKWMKPHDTSSIYPSKAIKFTIEVNQGWFIKRGIKPGVKVKF